MPTKDPHPLSTPPRPAAPPPSSPPPVAGIWTPQRLRMLKIGVATMTGLLILGIFALLYGVTQQMTKLGGGAAKPEALPSDTLYGQILAVAPGELRSVTATNGLIILDYKEDGLNLILTIDAQTGREVGRLQVPRR
jgi:hypothetical protein